MIIGLILGFCIGYIVATLIPKIKLEEDTTEYGIKDSMDICESILYGEPFITVRQEKALKKVLEYARNQIEQEDDLK